MKLVIVLFISAFFIASQATTETDTEWLKPANSDVRELTSADFDDVITKNPYVFVEFLAPWCEHCKSIAPTYEDLARTYKEKGNVIIAKVNGVNSPDIIQNENLSGYPSFKLFRNGVSCTYQGPGSEESFVGFIENKIANPTSKLLETKEAVEEFLAPLRPKVITVVDDKIFKVWRKVSDGDGFDYLNFAHVTDPALLGEGVKVGTVKIFPAVGDETFTYSGLFVKSKVLQFLKDNSYPIIQPLDEDSFHEISAKQVPHVVVYFWEGKEDFPMAIELAKKFKGKVIFSYKTVNDELVYWADQWGASGTKFPTAIMIQWPGPQDPKFTVYDEDSGDFNVASGENFVVKSLEGTYDGFRKSEPIPEKNDFPVKIVVGKSFEQIVFDDSKDVVVDFYAPWCEYSSALEPIWRNVGDFFENTPEIVIAKFDVTSNKGPREIDEKIKDLPSIILFPAGDKKNYVEFPEDHERWGKNIVEWILQNAKNKPQLDIANLAEDPEIVDDEPEEEADEKFEL